MSADSVEHNQSDDRDNLVDWSEAMEAVGGDLEILKTLTESVIEEAPNMLDAVRQAVVNRDLATLQTAAHALKGAIRYFGESAAYRHTLRLEEMGRNAAIDQAPQVLSQLDLELERLLTILKNRAPEEGGAG